MAAMACCRDHVWSAWTTEARNVGTLPGEKPRVVYALVRYCYCCPMKEEG